MIEKKENVVVKTAMKRKWSLLLTVLLDVAGTAGTIAVYYFIYKVIAEIVDKYAMVDEIDKSVIYVHWDADMRSDSSALYNCWLRACTFCILFSWI